LNRLRTTTFDPAHWLSMRPARTTRSAASLLGAGNFQRHALVPEPGAATLVGVGLVVVAARPPRRDLPARPEAPASCADRQPCRLGAS
jgi:hypothetical protein